MTLRCGLVRVSRPGLGAGAVPAGLATLSGSAGSACGPRGVRDPCAMQTPSRCGFGSARFASRGVAAPFRTRRDRKSPGAEPNWQLRRTHRSTTWQNVRWSAPHRCESGSPPGAPPSCTDKLSGGDGGCAPPIMVETSPDPWDLADLLRCGLCPTLRGVPFVISDDSPTLFTGRLMVKVHFDNGDEDGGREQKRRPCSCVASAQAPLSAMLPAFAPDILRRIDTAAVRNRRSTAPRFPTEGDHDRRRATQCRRACSAVTYGRRLGRTDSARGPPPSRTKHRLRNDVFAVP